MVKLGGSYQCSALLHDRQAYPTMCCRLECSDLTVIYCFCLQEELGQIGVALLPEMVVKRTRI